MEHKCDRLWRFTVCALAWVPWMAAPAAGANYLPLQAGNRWTLRNAQLSQSVSFEVLTSSVQGSQVRFTTPWGAAEYTLSASGSTIVMTQYGAMPLSARPAYFDFSQLVGGSWSNLLGTFTLESRTATISSAGGTPYSNCIRIRHGAGARAQVFTFAPDVGFVAYGEGAGMFVLQELQLVPEPPPTETTPTTPTAKTPVLVGMTPNRFAYEPQTVEVVNNRLRQTVQAGATFLVGSGEWATLEPSAQSYNLDSTVLLVNSAKSVNLPLFYTLRIINTVQRDVPSDLAYTAWDSPQMTSRLLQLIDRLAPILNGQVKWITIGYESDCYLLNRQSELTGFVQLFQQASQRFRVLLPGVKVSTTLTFLGLPSLSGQLSGLNANLDFLAVNYSLLNPDFTVVDPSHLPYDFAIIKSAAARRKIVLQELAYPSGADANSSSSKQSEFYQRAFDAVLADTPSFDAMNFMMLADLSDSTTALFATYYGLNTPAFKATIQTLGVFDKNGVSKPAWGMFTANAPSLK